MNPVERIAYETAEEVRRDAAERAERVSRANAEATGEVRRRAEPELRYRTTITQPEPQPTVEAATPAQLDALDKSLRRHITQKLNNYTTQASDVIAQCLSNDRRRMREHVVSVVEPILAELEHTRAQIAEERAHTDREIELTRRELAVLKAEVAATREHVTAELARLTAPLLAQLEHARTLIVEERQHADREIELTRRELDTLRDEMGLAKNLRTLNDQVEATRAQIPDFKSLEATLNAKHSGLEAEQARLHDDLKTTREKLGKLRVENSQLEYSLKKLEEAKTQSGVEISFTTSESSFAVKDLDPNAATAWKEFCSGIVEAAEQNPGTTLSLPGGHVLSMPIPRRQGC